MLLTLSGTDEYAKQERLQSVAPKAKRLFVEDGLDSWLSQIGQPDLFGQAPTLVLDNALGLLLSDRQRLATHLQALHIPQSDQLVIFMAPDKLPKDDLAAILQQGTIEHLAPLSQTAILRWVEQEAAQHGVTIAKSVIPSFVRLFESNRFAIATEIQKWSLHTPAVIDEDSLSTMVPPSGSIPAFGLAESWGQRRSDQALNQLQSLWRQREAPQALIALLERQARLMSACHQARQAGMTSSSPMGIAPFVADKMAAAAKKWPSKALYNAIEQLFWLDSDIKSGQIEPQLGIELWIVDTIGKAD